VGSLTAINVYLLTNPAGTEDTLPGIMTFVWRRPMSGNEPGPTSSSGHVHIVKGYALFTKKLAFVAVLAAGALTMAACGSSGGSSSPSTPKTPPKSSSGGGGGGGL
jgi:hypothetical protein